MRINSSNFTALAARRTVERAKRGTATSAATDENVQRDLLLAVRRKNVDRPQRVKLLDAMDLAAHDDALSDAWRDLARQKKV